MPSTLPEEEFEDDYTRKFYQVRRRLILGGLTSEYQITA